MLITRTSKLSTNVCCGPLWTGDAGNHHDAKKFCTLAGLDLSEWTNEIGVSAASRFFGSATSGCISLSNILLQQIRFPVKVVWPL